MLQLPPISGTIRMDLDPLKQAFGEASREGHGWGAHMDGVMKGIGVAAIASAAVITTAFVGVGSFIVDATRDSFKLADDLHDMAINVGVGVESLHGLGLAAGLAGSGVGDVAESYKFLGKNVTEAMQGSKEAVAAFDRMGVAFADARGNARPLEEVMMNVADAMAAMDKGARGEAAMQLLGRGGTQMIATLSQGSVALREQMRLHERYGATVTTQAANAADAFGDMLGEFDIAWLGIKNAIGQPVIEGLTPALEGLLDWTRTNFPDIRNSISAAFGAMATELANLTGGFRAAGAAGDEWGLAIVNAAEMASLAIAKSLDLLDSAERKRSGAGSWLKQQTTQLEIGQLEGQIGHKELQFAPEA
ncbi:MAG: hypothetical protein QOF78_590, partial [Phycisphaerales bacterium]|nr:hypothetical protein [Phycisphaerales bacterium]